MMRKYHVRFEGGLLEKGSNMHLAGSLPGRSSGTLDRRRMGQKRPEARYQISLAVYMRTGTVAQHPVLESV